MDTNLEGIDAVVERLQSARRVLIITGAGISADSGLPTYRGIGGLYNDADTEEGLPIEVALSGDVMQIRPDVTWKYLAQIESACRRAGPNAAHRIIAQLQERVPTTVLTQNIDGFHRQAGSRDLIEIHGDLFDVFCMDCDRREQVPDYGRYTTLPPICPECGGTLRPGVVLFGEALPARPLRRLQQVLDEGYDLVLSIGTTSVFPYIAQPFAVARHFDALAVEVNPATTQVSRFADHAWRCGAAHAMESLWEALERA